jgi:acyl-CoA thioester hydrolase
MQPQTLPLKTLHQFDIAVRWGDMDGLGHINNIVYLQYFEEARVLWMSSLGGVLRPDQAGMILKKSAVTYNAPVSHPATLRVTTRAGSVGRTSFGLVGDMHLIDADGKPHGASVCDGEFVIVWFDYAAQKPALIPDWLRAVLGAGAQTAGAQNHG